MLVLLFRHAERLSSMREDPPLSPRGMEQAQSLSELVLQKKFPLPTRILSTPKIRGIQTLEKLAERQKIPLQIHRDLDEKASSEHSEIFSKRVKKMLESLSNLGGTVYVVTHLDWLEEAMIHIPSDTNLNTPPYQGWSPGQGIEFEVVDGLWTHVKQRRIP